MEIFVFGVSLTQLEQLGKPYTYVESKVRLETLAQSLANPSALAGDVVSINPPLQLSILCLTWWAKVGRVIS